MLYYYTQVTHPINNLHKYMHYFFIQLFAEVSTVYNKEIHIHRDFRSIIETHKTLNDKLEVLFDRYMALPTANEKLLIQQAYNNNNNIEQVCGKTVKPIKLTELPVSLQPILESLYGANGALYSMLTKKNSFPKVKNRCGSLKGHFEKFRESNKISVCPFCGMENILTDYDNLKNEYDHYLSKGKYPFCSINFNNLTPICDYCNKSGNKGQKDIAFDPSTKPPIQEEIYFPYTSNEPDHEIILSIRSTKTDLKEIDSWILNVNCEPLANIRKKDRWMEIYNIETRYKAKIAGDSYQWKDRIISKYSLRCKKNKMSFIDFKADILDDFSDYKKWNNGILMKCFDEFIMNAPHCEDNLTGKIF